MHGKFQGSRFGKYSVLANEEAADTDFGGVRLNQQRYICRAREKIVQEFNISRFERKSVARVTPKIAYSVSQRRRARLQTPEAIFKSDPVFFREQVGRATTVFARYSLKILNPHNRRNAGSDGADQHAADFGPALRHRTETSHYFRRQAIYHVQPQVNYHRLARSPPDVVAGGILCWYRHFGYRFIVLR